MQGFPMETRRGARGGSQLAMTAAICLTALITGQAGAALPLGSPNLEPGLRGRSDIIFFEDFESADWYRHWNGYRIGKGPLSSNPENCQRVEEPAFEGSSLRVTIVKGQRVGTEPGVRFSEWGVKEPEEVYFRYYVYFAKNWKVTEKTVVSKKGIAERKVLHGGKLPGVSGTYNRSGWGNRIDRTGTKGWSARMGDVLWDSSLRRVRGEGPPGWFATKSGRVRISFYTYFKGGRAHFYWDKETRGHLEHERWYAVEGYVKLNTITDGKGNKDGILRGWVDGKLAFEKTDLIFRDVDRLKIEKFWFNIYCSGGNRFGDRDMHVYFDNIVIARKYIGPMAAPKKRSERTTSGEQAKTETQKQPVAQEKPAVRKKVVAKLTPEPRRLLNMTRNYVLNRMYDSVRARLRSINKKYPETPESREARKLLAEIRGIGWAHTGTLP